MKNSLVITLPAEMFEYDSDFLYEVKISEIIFILRAHFTWTLFETKIMQKVVLIFFQLFFISNVLNSS